ncbi:MAG: hypothetical protein AAGA25_16895 [Planctomycetota bacterium]
MSENTTLPDQLAAESMRQLLHAMLTLSEDTTVSTRIKLVSEASRLLERTETKHTVVERLGSSFPQGGS